MIANELHLHMNKISFLHSGIPRCASPIVSYAEEFPEYLGIHGTGFFARKRDRLVFITARHCLSNAQDEKEVADIAARLQVPYTLDGIKQPTDYVKFTQAQSYRHVSDDLPGQFLDVLILSIEVKKESKQDKHLRSRSVKLPPNGQWLEKFSTSSLIQDAFQENAKLPLMVTGYPHNGTATRISDNSEVVSQLVQVSGNMRPGAYLHTLSMRDITWGYDLNGFSGAPVFIRFKNEHGHQYALVGMLITGGNRQAQLIRVGYLTAHV